MKTLHTTTTILFTLAITGAAVSELFQSEVVIESLESLAIPVRLLYFLGVLKLIGAVTLLFSHNTLLKEWAYAGFIFNLTGAVFLLFTADQVILPDIIVAPSYLMLCLVSYFSFKKLPAHHRVLFCTKRMTSFASA